MFDGVFFPTKRAYSMLTERLTSPAQNGLLDGLKRQEPRFSNRDLVSEIS